MKVHIISFLFFALVFMEGTAKAETLVMGVDNAYRPHYWTEHGQIVGPALDVCKAVLRDMGYEIRVKITPWARVLHELENGGSDFICLLVHKKEREAYSYFAQEVMSENHYQLIANVESNFEWAGDYETLIDRSVSSVRAWAYPLFYDDRFKRIDFDDERLVVRHVALNKDAIGVGLYYGLRNAAEKLGVKSEIRFLKPPLPVHALYAGFSKKKGHEELAQEYSKRLRGFKKTAAYQKIYRRYNMTAPVWNLEN